MIRRFSAVSLVALAAACSDARDDLAPVDYQGTQPGGGQAAPQQSAAAPSAAPSPVEAPEVVEVEPEQEEIQVAALGAPDPRGVRFYQGYETIVAQPGDTVDSMAARVGLEGSALAAYNGLSPLYEPTPGDELVLPAQPDGYRGGAAAAPAPAPEATPVTAAAEESAPTGESDSGFSFEAVASAISAAAGGAIAAVEEAAGGEEAAPEAQPAAPAEQSAVPEEPAAPAPVAVEAPEPQPAPAEEVAGAPEPAPAPAPEAPAAAPEEAPAAAPEEEEVVIAALREPEPGSKLFLRPVDGPVLKPFSRAQGPDRNDGVDFAAAPGTPVRAAESGVVALVSQSLGGLGTIVLIRHEDQFLTVYGRISDVAVSRGDRVERGQTIAVIADADAPRDPSLHFEVRRGAESVNPEDYL